MKRRKILFEMPDFLMEKSLKVAPSANVVVSQSVPSKDKKKRSFFNNLLMAFMDNFFQVLGFLIGSIVLTVIVIILINGDTAEIIQDIKDVFTVNK